MANFITSSSDIITRLFCVQCCVCRRRLSSPRCRSELIDSAWVVIVPWTKMHKIKNKKIEIPSKYRVSKRLPGITVCIVFHNSTK